MAGDGDVIHQDHPVADLRVMADMGAGHDQAIVADPRDAAAALGAGVQRGAFADAGARADDQPGAFAPNFRSCGTSPTQAKGQIVQSSPISVQPVTTACDFTVTPGPG
jgi:hypothetical protein